MLKTIRNAPNSPNRRVLAGESSTIVLKFPTIAISTAMAPIIKAALSKPDSSSKLKSSAIGIVSPSAFWSTMAWPPSDSVICRPDCGDSPGVSRQAPKRVLPLLACAADTASWSWVGQRLNRNRQWAPPYYGCGGEVGPTLRHLWIKLLQTALIIFRVSFNVKQKMSEIGREGARISASLTAPATAPV